MYERKMKKTRNISAPKQISNKEVIEKINFLTEIAKISAEIPELIDLSQYLGNEAVLSAQKSKIRLKPKHILCKNCNTPLISPLTSDIKVRGGKIYYACKNCKKIYKKHLNEKTPSKKVEHWIFHQEIKQNNLETLKMQHFTGNQQT